MPENEKSEAEVWELSASELKYLKDAAARGDSEARDFLVEVGKGTLVIMEEEQPPEDHKVGALEAAIMGQLDLRGAGFGDEIAGTYKMMTDSKDGGPELAYKKGRQAYKDREAIAKEEQKLAYYVGMFGPDLALALLTRGRSAPQTAKQMLLRGGMYGMASGVGHAEEGSRALGLLGGGLTGGVLSGVAGKAGEALGKEVAPLAKGSIKEWLAKALGYQGRQAAIKAGVSPGAAFGTTKAAIDTLTRPPGPIRKGASKMLRDRMVPQVAGRVGGRVGASASQVINNSEDPLIRQLRYIIEDPYNQYTQEEKDEAQMQIIELLTENNP